MRKIQRLSVLFRAALLVGIISTGSTALAVDVTQPPSAFDITTDGLFTSPTEWSDVIPAVRLGGESLIYTAVDPGLEALYLMYDLPSSTTPVGEGETAGPVHFHNSEAEFEIFFTCPSSILVLKDGLAFDVSDPAGGEDSIEGACGFGPSPSSAVPHNMFELEVLFDGSDPTLAGHSHGVYSPDPSHWGAALPPLPTDPGEPPICTVPVDPDCDSGNDPVGGGLPQTVQCPLGGPGGCGCNADLNGDGLVTVADFSIFFSCLGGPAIGGCESSDLNCDGVIDSFDNDIFQCQFEGGVPNAACCEDVRFSFGAEVSNACVNVVRGSGGTTQVTAILFPVAVPTLSQSALILVGLLLLGAGFLTIRRRGLPTQIMMSLLVLIAAGVGAVGASYVEIESSRTCGETDVAVEFVSNLLNL